MRLFMIALLPLLTCLPLAAQDAEAQKKFAGTWEAKLKDKVICTLRLKAGEQFSGETEACSINVDANGDLQERDSTEPSDNSPAPIQNAKLRGDTLIFEEKNNAVTANSSPILLRQTLASPGFAHETLAHEHFQESLVADALPLSDPPGLRKIGFRQPDGDLHATLLIHPRN